MEPIHKRVAGLDVHRMKQVVTVLVEEEDGRVTKATRPFGGFKRDLRALVSWLNDLKSVNFSTMISNFMILGCYFTKA